jgi:proteasome lid subunit RPN8/RPN11
MSNNCQLVVFSNKAYNAIIRESFDKNPVETGGILLGHILENGVWIVMEVLPPGLNSVFEYAYFEYDTEFVNYLAQSVANQYKIPLDLLGLWHRHPGGMDVFSTTDDGTNITFARLNSQGVISGLVNIDPQFRLTMYHLAHQTTHSYKRPLYEKVEIEIGDDIIPDEYFELRYYSGEESEKHPSISRSESPRGTHNIRKVVSSNSPSATSKKTFEDSNEYDDPPNNSNGESSSKKNSGSVMNALYNAVRQFWKELNVLSVPSKVILVLLIALIVKATTIIQSEIRTYLEQRKEHPADVDVLPTKEDNTDVKTSSKFLKVVCHTSSDSVSYIYDIKLDSLVIENLDSMLLPVKDFIKEFIPTDTIKECSSK